jgi:opacity protein-like surface antigen
MNKYLWLLCIFVTTVFITGHSEAAVISKGSIEISADANLTFDHSEIPRSSTNTSSGTMRIGCGYFVTDGLQIGGSAMDTLSKSKTTGSDPTDSNTFDLDMYAKYHIYPNFWASNRILKPIVPYFGAQGGWINVSSRTKGDSSSDNAFSYGVMGGVKYFVADNISVNGELNYRRYEVSIGQNAPKNITDDFKILLGFSIFLAK